MKWLTILIAPFTVSIVLAAHRPPRVQCTKLEKPPKNSTCGVRGHVSSLYHTRLPQIVPDLDSCQDMCVRRERKGGCEAYVFNETSRICQIVATTTFGYRFEPNAKSDVAVWYVSCFECDTPCPNRQGQNLLDNGDFEYSELPGPWQDARIVSPGLASKYAAKFTSARNRSNAGIIQSFHGCIGVYVIEFDYRVFGKSDDVRNCTFYFMSKAGFTYFCITNLIDQDTGWRHAVAAFNYPGPYSSNPPPAVGKQAAVVVFEADSLGFESDAGGTVLLDNVALKQVPAESTTPSENLLLNSGFESGGPEPWTVVAGAPYGFSHYSIVSPGLSGSYAFQWIYGGDSFAGDIRDFPYITLQQAITTVPGDLYLLEFDYKYNETRPRHNQLFNVNLGNVLDRNVSTLAKYQNFAQKGQEQIYHFSEYFFALDDHSQVTIQIFDTYHLYYYKELERSWDPNTEPEEDLSEHDKRGKRQAGVYTIDNLSLTKVDL